MSDDSNDTPVEHNPSDTRETPLDQEPVLESNNASLPHNTDRLPDDLTPPPDDAPPRLGTEPSNPTSEGTDLSLNELIEKFVEAADDADLDESNSFEEILEGVAEACGGEIDIERLDALLEKEES